MSLLSVCLLLVVSVSSVDGRECHLCQFYEDCSTNNGVGTKTETCRKEWEGAECGTKFWEYSYEVTRGCVPACATEGCEGLNLTYGMRQCCCKGDLCNTRTELAAQPMKCYKCSFGEDCTKTKGLGKEETCPVDWTDAKCETVFMDGGLVTRGCVPACATEGCEGLNLTYGMRQCCCKGDLCNTWTQQTTKKPVLKCYKCSRGEECMYTKDLGVEETCPLDWSGAHCETAFWDDDQVTRGCYPSCLGLDGCNDPNVSGVGRANCCCDTDFCNNHKELIHDRVEPTFGGVDDDTEEDQDDNGALVLFLDLF